MRHSRPTSHACVVSLGTHSLTSALKINAYAHEDTSSDRSSRRLFPRSPTADTPNFRMTQRQVVDFDRISDRSMLPQTKYLPEENTHYVLYVYFAHNIPRLLYIVLTSSKCPTFIVSLLLRF